MVKSLHLGGFFKLMVLRISYVVPSFKKGKEDTKMTGKGWFPPGLYISYE